MGLGEVVAALVEREHGAVSKALRRQVGDDRLFVELRAIGRATVDDDGVALDDDVDVGAVVGLTADEGVALDWIKEGMPL